MPDIFNMTDTWNDGGTTFTAILMDVLDTASDAASLLMDLKVGGTTKFKIDKAGQAVAGGVYLGGEAAANLMDDYEEGTWIPELSDGTNEDASYAVRSGDYTKIGNVVHAQCTFALTSLGSISGALQINDLPFVVSGSAAYQACGTVGIAGGLLITAGEVVAVYANGGGSIMPLVLWDDAGGNSPLTSTELTAAGSLSISITYATTA